MSKDVIREGDERWERLYETWLNSDSKDAGWLVAGGEQYQVIATNDDAIIFIPIGGNIDSMYGTYTGVPKQ